MRQHRPRMMMFCNPNNPTGKHTYLGELKTWVEQHQDTLFVFDEAYTQFAIGKHSMLSLYRNFQNVLLVRSMTKDYALAGLRLGYLIGESSLIQVIANLRPAWNVNGFAQAGGITVLDQWEWFRDSLHQLINSDMVTLMYNLSQSGLEVMPSDVHYFLVRVGNATEFRAKLLEHKIMVRDCTSFGLPEYVRIATRTPEDNAKLIAAIEQVQHDR
ncbi:MAG: aminotransferase class I/II-fold pyridoxal phosphate-dependent enzyme [Chloroflexota bacterium]